MGKKSGKDIAQRQVEQNKETLKRQFKKFDKDGNGYLEGKEVAKFMTALQVANDAATRRAFFKLVDKNNDGKLSFAEFEQAIKEVGNKTAEKEDDLIFLFDSFDVNGDGVIDGKELKAVVRQFADKTKIKSRRDILKRFDRDRDGTIDYAEFRQMVNDLENEEKDKKLAERMFAKFDKDRNGKITPSEFDAFLEEISLATSGQQRLQLRKAMGNEKGHFTKEQFVQVYIASMKAAEKRDAQIRKAFEAADENKSGALSRKEIAKLLPKLGIELSEKEIEDRLNDADIDGNKVLDLAEFKEFMFKLQRS